MERASSETRQGEGEGGGLLFRTKNTRLWSRARWQLQAHRTRTTARPGSPAPSDTSSHPSDTTALPRGSHHAAMLRSPIQLGKAMHLRCLRSTNQSWQQAAHPFPRDLQYPPKAGQAANSSSEMLGTAQPPPNQLEPGCPGPRVQPDTTQAILLCCSNPSTRKSSEYSQSQFKQRLKCRNFPYCEIVL